MSLEAEIGALRVAVQELTRAFVEHKALASATSGSVVIGMNTDPKIAYDAVRHEHEASLRLTPEQQADVAKFEAQGGAGRYVAVADQNIEVNIAPFLEIPNEKSSPTTDTSPPSSQASVTYDDVKAVTIAVSKMDKAKAVAGLARFGAKNAKELKEEQWRDYVDYMTKVHEGEIDPESSHE